MVYLQKVTKIEVAFRQLKTAIQLYITEGDTVSAYTLVRASEEILDKLCKHNNLERGVIFQGLEQLPISDEGKKYIRHKLNEPKNYFKHADVDPDKEIEWGDGVIEHFIRDCITMYKRLEPNKEAPCELTAFSLIHRVRNNDMYDESGLIEFDNSLSEISELITRNGLPWVYNSMIEACEMNITAQNQLNHLS